MTAADIKFQASGDALRRVAEQNSYQLVDAPGHGRYHLVPVGPSMRAPEGEPAALTFAEVAHYFRVGADGTPLYPPALSADDPDLAEHALWNDEIAGDLEEMALEYEADRRVQALPDISEYEAGIEREYRVEKATAAANEARTELARLAALTEAAAYAYRGAITELHESGMSYAKIGAVLGISRGTVQGHVERGRR